MTSLRYGEIEIGLHRSQPEAYDIEIRVIDPDSDAEVAPARGQAQISLRELSALAIRPDDYGAQLADSIFRDRTIREFYLQNKAAFDSRGLLLRLRVLIGPSVPELHAVIWELLRDPDTKFPLATSERVLFSRFMLSPDWRVVKLRPKASLKALIAVAAPPDAGRWAMAEVDYAGEVERARAGLSGIEATAFAKDEPVTLDRLMDGIRQGVDVLYLVCHGALPKGEEPCLYLQNAEGLTEVVLAGALAQRIRELQEAPRLIVLASCESAKADGGPLAHAALAPRLAEAGVPAVLAMQGKISMETVKLAMPAFFRELAHDGQIDRAMAVARGVVRDRFDQWMPALYLRLKSGRIWYEPGFGAQSKDDFKKWASLCRAVRNRKFMPILGPELGEDVFGGTREMASSLAEKHAFPLADSDRTDLAKVAQFIATDQDPNFAREAVREQFLVQLARRVNPPGSPPKPSNELLTTAVEHCRANPDHPYSILAELPAKIFVNASIEPILLMSLKAAGRNPEAVVGSWRRRLGVAIPKEPQPKIETPKPECPWVYHVFGMLRLPETMVLTEDDFFDYLINTSTLNLVPHVIRGSLLENSLLFLGFRLDDWRFRILFRMIMTLEGAEALKDYSHVGVQVNPDEHSMSDVRRAMKYLESYFQESKSAPPSISIFWGSAADFLKELKKRLAEAPVQEREPEPVAEGEEYV